MKFGRVYGKSCTTSNIASRNLHVWMNRNKDFTQQPLHNTAHLHLKVLPSYAVTNNQFITNCRSSSNCTHWTPNTVVLADTFKIQQIQSERLGRILFTGTTNRALSRHDIRSCTVWYKKTAGSHQSTNTNDSAGQAANEHRACKYTEWSVR
jgi:hypothetical protein